MVRVNIIHPKKLADQHLIAEYVEILMLVSSAKISYKPEKIPTEYVLGKGHINFFKNKIKYLVNRHALIKKEMRNRKFKARKNIDLSGLKKEQIKNWSPKKADYEKIIQRLLFKINKKPFLYRYYGKNKSPRFFIDLLKK